MSERRYPVEPRVPAVLTVDVGGSHVKAVLNGHRRAAALRLRPGAHREADGRRCARADDGLGLHPGVASACRPRSSDGRVLHDPVNLGTGWTTLDYEQVVRQAHEGGQRCRDAGVRQLRGRPHAVPRARDGARVDDDPRGHDRADGARPPSVPQGDVRGLRRRAGARAAREQALAQGRDRHRRAADCRPAARLRRDRRRERGAPRRRASTRTAGSGTTRLRSSAASASGSIRRSPEPPTRPPPRAPHPRAAPAPGRGASGPRTCRVRARRRP